MEKSISYVRSINSQTCPSTYLAWCLPLISIFFPYKVFDIYLPLLFLFIFSAFKIFSNKDIQIYKPFFIFFLYTFISYSLKSVFCAEFQTVHLNNILSLFLVNGVIISCSGYMDDDVIYKTYKIFGFLAALGIIYHAFCVFIMGASVSPIALLPNAGLRFLEVGDRPVSVFQEPASYALFLLPLLYLSVIKNDIKVLVFFSLTLLLSTSTSGIAIGILIWVYYFLKKQNLKSIFFPVCMLALLIFAFTEMQIFDSARIKLFEALHGDSTTNIRLFIGSQVYWRLPLMEKIFGIFSPSLMEYLYAHADKFGDIEGLLIYLDHYAESGGFYTNFVFLLLINYGLLGFSLFIYFLYSLFQSLTAWKLYPWILLTVGFGMNYYLGPEYIISILLMLSQRRRCHTHGVNHVNPRCIW